MRFGCFLIANIICLSTLAYASPFVPPHLNVTLHEVYPSPICTLSSAKTPEDAVSTATLVVEGVGDPIPVEVVLSIDSSASMNRTDPDKKRLKAAKGFLEVLDSGRDKAGLVIWSLEVKASENLTNNFDVLYETIDNVEPKGGTDIYVGLKEAIDTVLNGSSGVKKCVVFLSDGTSDADESYHELKNFSEEVDRAKNAGIEIWTVGFPVDPVGEVNLKEIANTTGGEYHPANNFNVENVFLEIYRNMTSLAGKDITVEYLAPADLLYSIDYDHIEGANKVFVWNPRDLYVGDKWIKTFKVSSENPGWFTLGKSPGSAVSYTMFDRKHGYIPIEERTLQVIPCDEDSDYSIIKFRDIYGTNINVGSGSIDNEIEGENISFGSGSICSKCNNNNTTPDPDGEPCEKVICVCVNATCPECAEVMADNGSKVNNINIVQTTIFGSIPSWNGTGDTVEVINLTVSRPEAAIDAVFAFDVSGSMRLPYERMDEDARSAFAESNFSNVSIIGWDEDDGEGADRLIVPPQPLGESEETVLAVMRNLSGYCDETDQTVYAAGLRGVLEVDDEFGDHFSGDEKIVLFITGPDEFRPGDKLNESANELKRRGYAIYTVGVEIDEIESPLKYDNLSRMASLTGGQFYPIGGLDSDELREVLRNAAAHASSKAAPKDVVATETLPAHLEVKKTVPSGAEVDVAKNLDGTTTLTWTASGVRPGESRTLIILTSVKGALPPDEIGTIAAAEGIDIRPTGGDAAGVNVINMRTEDGDVKMGENS